ncbi:MAG TPA: carboxypeptidase-like regulatory domain-containing protein [Bryobacteraceae bacterium]|nr:carboxypeptidase-like regulatory domain-containing protein [Bryobacteraceae bacterium]
MSRLVFAIPFMFIAPLAAQSGAGSLTGAISDAYGVAVADAPIQVKNMATGALARTASKRDGTYTLAGLAAGSYEFSIVMPCCAYKSIGRDITLEPGKTAQLNIKLVETVNGTTLGDDPGRLAVTMRNRAKIPSQPVPRGPGGKPDLSGLWVGNDDRYPEQPQVLPWAAALIQERQESNGKDAPHNHCLPGPPPAPGSTAPFIAKLVQTGSLLVILFEDVPGFRQVFLDGRAHPANWDPTWMGHSVGKWEGAVLVVDTVGFNDRSWLGGLGGGLVPHTEMLHMTERYQRTDFGHLELSITFDDPGTFVKPYHMNVKLDLAPQEEVMEYVCENNKPEHLVGK